jgi:putative spermidine/putrescine transport system ATP-binding protein
VVHAGSDPGRGNTIGAQVRSVVYFGDHLRLMCKVGERGEATVKMALGAPAAPSPGDALWLELPPDLTRVYT